MSKSSFMFENLYPIYRLLKNQISYKILPMVMSYNFRREQIIVVTYISAKLIYYNCSYIIVYVIDIILYYYYYYK